MRSIMIILAVGAALSLAVAGCGQGGGGEGESQDIISALQIQDGSTPYNERQFTCPVCGGKPISPDYYADVNGKRIYFDKEECAEKFKQDPETHLKQYRQEMMKSMGGPQGGQ